ncbi:ribonuclease P protein component [Piscinibacter sakaiensis]|uniref:ribonuclease P protein component n=1 Tax=Piscinibacter sakaiensis TaxID=1547922 RepID=UPI003AAC360F
MGRIVRPVDFQRVLGTSPWARSPHFAVHHLQQAPARRVHPAADIQQLSTAREQACPPLVDELPAQAPVSPPVDGWWLGLVVPKRHAKRSVTRSLLKRQMRAAAHAAVPPAQPSLRPGMWVVRLRAVIDRKKYPSAASEALRRAMHDELQQLMLKAALRCDG